MLRDLPDSSAYVSYIEAYEAIRNLFTHQPSEVPESRYPLYGNIQSELLAIEKEIVLSNELVGTPVEPYLSIAYCLRDALRQENGVPTVCVDDERWVKAIWIAWLYNERKEPNLRAPYMLNAASVTFAQAVKFFRSKGVRVALRGDVVSISQSVWAALSATASSPLLALGDTQAMQYVGHMLMRRFDVDLFRVRLHPYTDVMGQKMDRSLPYGHLYRLALRSLGRRRNINRSRIQVEDINTAATHFAALYEVEPFSTYEVMFLSHPARVLDELRRVVLYDELFTVPQCDPTSMQHLMEMLLKKIEIGKTCTVPPLDHVLVLWASLLQVSPANVNPTFIARSQLKTLLARRLGSVATERLLAAFAISEPNRRYALPSDAVHTETRECALVEASGDRYWIAPKPFLGPAFFARLVSVYVPFVPHLSGKIGDAFENHLVDRMRELGISCRHAQVAGKKGMNAGDLDVIIETEDMIAFFELKKKGLTRKTSSGNDLQLAVDLVRGLIQGVNQLARHELSLLTHGELKFTDGTVLHLKQRRIVKCVVSLADYGGLHDSAVVFNMLRAFCQITLGATPGLNAEQSAYIKEANDAIATLQKRYEDFDKVKPHKHSDLFENVLFRNIFFIEHVLMAASNAETFLTELLRGSRMVTGARDPFFERAMLSK